MSLSVEMPANYVCVGRAVLLMENLHVEDIDMEDTLPLHRFHLLEIRLILALSLR